MSTREGREPIDAVVTSEQIARLEQAVFSLKDSSTMPPDVAEAMARTQYNYIQELRAELDAALGFGQPAPDLIVSLGGPQVHLGSVTARSVTKVLDELQTAVRNVFTWLADGVSRPQSRPRETVSRATGLKLVGVGTGSIRLFLNLPGPDESASGGSRETMENAVRSLLDVAEWASTEQDASALMQAKPDVNLARVLLENAQRIIPGQGSEFDYMILSGNLVDARDGLFLTPAAHSRLNDARLKLQNREPAGVTVTGTLRAIDKDKQTVKLRASGNKSGTLWKIPAHMMEQVFQYLASDTLVTLEGVQEYGDNDKPRPLKIRDIHPATNR